MNDLQFCCQALTEIGAAWKNGVRALEVLICIKREWQGKAMWSKGGGYLKRPLEAGMGKEEGRKRRIVQDKNEDHQERGHGEMSRNGNGFGGNGLIREEDFPLMGSYVENSLALGYLSTFPMEFELREEGLSSLDSLG